MDAIQRQVMTDWITTVLFPGFYRYVAIGGQTDFTIPAGWATTDQAIVYVAGKRYASSAVTLPNATTVRISPAAQANDQVLILMTPGGGSGYLPRSGSSLLGDLDAASHRILNLLNPSNPQDAATKNYVDTLAASLGSPASVCLLLNGGNSMGADLNHGGFKGTNMAAPVASTDAANKTYVDALVPTGTILDFAGATAPTGWVLCDGSTKDSVADTTLAPLYGVLGTLYGGTGASAFKIPDCRGRVRIGVGTGVGLTARALAATGGEEAHVLTVPEMPGHTHNSSDGNAFLTLATAGRYSAGGEGKASTVATASTGGDGAHNTMQPFIALNAIIKK